MISWTPRSVTDGMADLFETRVWLQPAAQTAASPPPAEVVERLSKMKPMWQ